MDPPAHNGIYLGDCAHTDGIYIWDQDHPEQPVRISRNFLDRSFYEQCAITSEPIGVSDEQYEMLQDEVNQLKTNSFGNDCEDHPAFDIANVPKERLEHWKTCNSLSSHAENGMCSKAEHVEAGVGVEGHVALAPKPLVEVLRPCTRRMA